MTMVCPRLQAAPTFPLDSLTIPERKCLILIYKGYSNENISAMLNISLRTFYRRRSKILEKAECENVRELWAKYHDILRSDFFKASSERILNDRETAIIEMILAGLSYELIGDKLCIEVVTVKYHISKIYQKLSIKNKTDLFIVMNSMAKTS
ncbi:helix-turn-helix transcriptional regulator [Persicobacter diffluens]|uniref:HTH luxR-type domain-containing protein n=1 Tax=Persicobacter diffluens TaxID=981 RepID=A0AAN4W5T3_9BACT|nr:hypothetical protein PEDI_51920 [Persicobacter diffluens]